MVSKLKRSRRHGRCNRRKCGTAFRIEFREIICKTLAAVHQFWFRRQNIFDSENRSGRGARRLGHPHICFVIVRICRHVLDDQFFFRLVLLFHKSTPFEVAGRFGRGGQFFLWPQSTQKKFVTQRVIDGSDVIVFASIGVVPFQGPFSRRLCREGPQIKLFYRIRYENCSTQCGRVATSMSDQIAIRVRFSPQRNNFERAQISPRKCRKKTGTALENFDLINDQFAWELKKNFRISEAKKGPKSTSITRSYEGLLLVKANSNPPILPRTTHINFAPLITFKWAFRCAPESAAVKSHVFFPFIKHLTLSSLFTLE